MIKATQEDVALYFNAFNEIQELIERNPIVNASYLCNTVFNRYHITEEWFADMQEHHKQHISDSVRGPR